MASPLNRDAISNPGGAHFFCFKIFRIFSPGDKNKDTIKKKKKKETSIVKYGYRLKMAFKVIKM